MVCEKCWERAQKAAMLQGGSVADHYHDALNDGTCDEPLDPELVAILARVKGGA